MSEYTIPKPKFPIAARILAGAVILGLVGLGLVAYEVFRLIDNPLVAGAFALVIELGAISEALSILKRNRPAIVGLVISLAVSGLYNFVRADQVAANLARPIDGIYLWALAIGPLSAVLFLALSLGHELREYERRVNQWEQDRQRWLDDQAEREARRLERREARQEKAAALAASPQLLPTSRQVLPGFVEEGRSSIETSRGSYTDFVELLRGNGSHEWKNEELSRKFGVSTRTITTWRARYAQESPIPTQEAN